MILSGSGIDHLRSFHPLFDAVAHKEIVDSPARVVDLAGLDPLCPPGINSFHIAVNISEGIGEASVQEVGEAFSLFIRKARGHVIGFRMGQVDLPVCHIEVAARDHGLFPVQLRQIIRIEPVPFLPVAQSLQSVAGIGRIYVDEIKIIIFQNQQSSLVIHCVGCADPGNNFLSLDPLFTEDHGPRVTLPGGRLRADPFDMIPGKIFCQGFHVLFGWSSRRQLGLLNRDQISAFFFEGVQYVSGQLGSGRR